MTNHSVGHNDRLYRRHREALRQHCQTNQIGCHLCGKPIDFNSRIPAKWSFTVDHILSRAEGGARDDPHNMAPAHYWCNADRGDTPLAEYLARRARHDPKSEQWP